ncbi:hypothetical protein EUGRSUZ_H00981 [Eucalyptus grandis]|uniref:Uncharacterized protein n=2 Tax=Eucalyptus grandis TaxID=71139 RepID=A0ACC3KBU6_EUCGR|nr:hypothetical protein EUGRSUZ_H00981 [Eucalyptus grandis]
MSTALTTGNWQMTLHTEERSKHGEVCAWQGQAFNTDKARSLLSSPSFVASIEASINSGSTSRSDFPIKCDSLRKLHCTTNH